MPPYFSVCSFSLKWTSGGWKDSPARCWKVVGPRLRVKEPTFAGSPLRWISRYDVDLYPGHPLVRMVGGGVEMATRRGSRVLAVVAPIPIDVLRELDHYEVDRFSERIEVLRAAVEENGGELLDLHDLLGRDGFSDAMGHMGREGTGVFVARLLPAVQRQLDRAASVEPNGRRSAERW